MMYLFLLVGNPIYCRLYCQRVMHPHPWVSMDKRWWIYLTSCWFDSGIASEHLTQPNLNHNYVFISLIAFRETWKEGGTGRAQSALVFPFKSENAWYLLATELLLWDRVNGHIYPGVHMHFLFIVLHTARFLPLNQCLLVGGIEAL